MMVSIHDLGLRLDHRAFPYNDHHVIVWIVMELGLALNDGVVQPDVEDHPLADDDEE